jgi:hypothetical protein
MFSFQFDGVLENNYNSVDLAGVESLDDLRWFLKIESSDLRGLFPAGTEKNFI